MRIYIDNCAIQRPLDTKNQLRIVFEAEAILRLLEFCKSDQAELITSDILRFEIRKCQDVLRREYVTDILKKAKTDVLLTDKIRKRALELEGLGFRGVDALHLASAEAGKANFFCTCDDGIIKKAKSKKLSRIKVFSPPNLMKELKL
ncbi:MAG: type II toxin-antitoxin system VapC family toxin [Desulfobacteraceae bacterium]|nr:type II toxin-antitoxin system VapC family toxin [Desulfobacteraceae bacterium]